MIKLVHDWRDILRRAWSVRLIVVAVILSGAEVYFSFTGGIDGVPAGVFAAASGVTSGLAFVARLMAQKEFDDGRD